MVGLTFPPPLVEASHLTPSQRTAVDLIVLHSAEDPEKPGQARAVAEWASRLCGDVTCSAHPGRANTVNPGPKASFHYIVDEREVIQAVREKDVAWGAPGANRNGIHVEHAGKASQSANDWGDQFSMAMLHLSIELCATICRAWSIPAVFVDADAMELGTTEPTPWPWFGKPARGITMHSEVTKAFNTPGGHHDPGENFPISWFCGRVADLLAEGSR